MFKNDEFKIWLKEQNVEMEEFWKWPQEERAPYLTKFMDEKKDVQPWKFSTEELVDFINTF